MGNMPGPKAGAEIIAKMILDPGEHIAGITGTNAVLILGNKKGFEYLSRMYAYMANNVVVKGTRYDDDPDDHKHIETYHLPFNK